VAGHTSIAQTNFIQNWQFITAPPKQTIIHPIPYISKVKSGDVDIPPLSASPANPISSADQNATYSLTYRVGTSTAEINNIVHFQHTSNSTRTSKLSTHNNANTATPYNPTEYTSPILDSNVPTGFRPCSATHGTGSRAWLGYGVADAVIRASTAEHGKRPHTPTPPLPNLRPFGRLPQNKYVRLLICKTTSVILVPVHIL